MSPEKFFTASYISSNTLDNLPVFGGLSTPYKNPETKTKDYPLQEIREKTSLAPILLHQMGLLHVQLL
jgi:hypothetical protein